MSVRFFLCAYGHLWSKCIITWEAVEEQWRKRMIVGETERVVAEKRTEDDELAVGSFRRLATSPPPPRRQSPAPLPWSPSHSSRSYGLRSYWSAGCCYKRSRFSPQSYRTKKSKTWPIATLQCLFILNTLFFSLWEKLIKQFLIIFLWKLRFFTSFKNQCLVSQIQK